MAPIKKLIAQVAHPMPDLEGAGALANPGVQSGTLLEKVIGNVIGVMTIVAFTYFVFQIIFAGYGLLGSDGDSQKIKLNTEKITRSIIGIIVIVAAIFLARLIGTLLGIQNILNINDWVTNVIHP
jgi:hypothetical protein